MTENFTEIGRDALSAIEKKKRKQIIEKIRSSSEFFFLFFPKPCIVSRCNFDTTIAGNTKVNNGRMRRCLLDDR